MLLRSPDIQPTLSKPEQRPAQVVLDFHSYKFSDAPEQISGWREIIRQMSEQERKQLVVRCPEKSITDLFYLTFNSAGQLAIASMDRKNIYVLDDITITAPQTTIDIIESRFPENLPPGKRPTL